LAVCAVRVINFVAILVEEACKLAERIILISYFICAADIVGIIAAVGDLCYSTNAVIGIGWSGSMVPIGVGVFEREISLAILIFLLKTHFQKYKR
jgi:hypothetical protein